MNTEDVSASEDQFVELLAAYDEALAAGAGNAPLVVPSVPVELHGRLRQACACLQRLEQDRLALRRDDPDVVAFPPPPSPAHTAAVGGGQLGRFELRSELGRGGFGIVFLAWDTWLRREVAVKVPRLEASLSDELRRRFLHEARAAAGLHHPGIVPVYEVGETDSICYIVSAYYPGIDLAQWLAQQTSAVPVRTAAALIADLAEAVQYVHEHHIWHRDIKPSNVLLQARIPTPAEGLAFVPRLMDFGLAKLLTAESLHTRSGDILGTPSYMAPEQAAGRVRQIGPHTDVYALGAVLYELLTGRPPFRAAAPLDVLRKITVDKPMPPRRRRHNVPLDLDIICLKCLEKEPASRYAGAGELAADLRRFLSGEVIAARPPNRRDRLRRWCLCAERVRSAGTFLLVFGLLFFLWCSSSLAVLALGVIKAPRPAAMVRYLAIHIGLFYVPMMAAGWRVLGGSRFALWMGTSAAFAFFFRMFFALICTDWLGGPPLLDMGGLFDNSSDRMSADLVFTVASAILCLHCVFALLASRTYREETCQSESDSISTLRELDGQEQR